MENEVQSHNKEEIEGGIVLNFESSETQPVAREWSDDETARLIALVEDRWILWDAGAALTNLPKLDLWQEVADLLGNVSAADCKAHFANLRITFKIYMDKYRNQESGQCSTESVAIQWRFFKLMKFVEINDMRQSAESTLALVINYVCFGLYRFYIRVVFFRRMLSMISWLWPI